MTLNLSIFYFYFQIKQKLRIKYVCLNLKIIFSENILEEYSIQKNKSKFSIFF